MKTYCVKHHRNYDCGHAHRSIESGLKCLKRHWFLTDFKCDDCDKVRRGFRMSNCKHCGCEDMVVSTPFDSDYFVLRASDDRGRTWRPLSAVENHEASELLHKKQYKKENA